MSRYRLLIDRDICQGHGVCAFEAPDLFALDDEGGPYPIARVTPDSIGDDVIDLAERAALYCPNGAIRIVKHEV